MKIKEFLNLTGLPVLIASLCCIAPVVLVLFGLSTVTFAATLTNILDGQYRWIFLLVGFLSLALSLVFYFRKRGICTIDQARRRRNEIINIVSLTIITAVVGYWFFLYVVVHYIGVWLSLWK